jgi:hypothetical protein
MKRFSCFRFRHSFDLVLQATAVSSLVVLNVLLFQTGTASAQAKDVATEPNVTATKQPQSVSSAPETPATVSTETEVAQPTVTRPEAPKSVSSESKAANIAAVTPLPPPALENCSCPCNVGKSASVEAPVDPFERKRGYGWQLAVADTANLSVHLVAGFANDKKWIDGPIPYTFIGTYVLSGPIVHLANGRLSQAGKSLGVRVVTPLVFGLLGSLVSTSERTVAGTILAGMSAGAVFDAWVLGRGDYVGVRTSRRGPMLSPWLLRDNHTVGAQIAWAY